MAAPQQPVRPKAGRELYLTKRHVRKFGATPGCEGCLEVGVRHTDACRKRFLELYPERLLTQEEERPGVGGTAEAEELLEGRAKRAWCPRTHGRLRRPCDSLRSRF